VKLKYRLANSGPSVKMRKPRMAGEAIPYP
jgi:hypothetical protein